MRHLALLLLIFTVSAFAMDAPTPPSLPGTLWTVTTLAGQPVLADHPVTFEFDSEGNITGDSSCNRFGGGCTIGDSTIKVGPLRSTRRACEPDIMQQERKFLALLSSATTWSITSDELLLTAPEGEIKATRRTEE